MGSISESFIKRTRGSHSANQEVPAAVFSLIYIVREKRRVSERLAVELTH